MTGIFSLNRTARPVTGRVVAVTGGARGIGLATARALHRKGARVAIGDLDRGSVEEAAGALGDGAIGMQLDVTDHRSFRDFLDATEKQLGPLDVLVNNAGIMPLGPFIREDDETTDRILAVNLAAVITGSRLALKRMVPRGSGQIVNLASQVGRAGFAGAATYSATKHAVIGLSASLVEELEETGIDVSCVMPAVVRTEMTAGVRSPRLIEVIGPDDVAAAITDVIERPRRNVHVPAIAAVIGPAGSLPAPLRHLIERALGARNLLLDTDRNARSAYEQRVTGPK